MRLDRRRNRSLAAELKAPEVSLFGSGSVVLLVVVADGSEASRITATGEAISIITGWGAVSSPEEASDARTGSASSATGGSLMMIILGCVCWMLL